MTAGPAPWKPGVRVLPYTEGPPQTDLQAAVNRHVDAAVDWALLYVQKLVLFTDNDTELAAAADRMSRAGAIVEWELTKAHAAAAAKWLPAHYDDETVEALLRGAR